MVLLFILERVHEHVKGHLRRKFATGDNDRLPKKMLSSFSSSTTNYCRRHACAPVFFLHNAVAKSLHAVVCDCSTNPVTFETAHEILPCMPNRDFRCHHSEKTLLSSVALLCTTAETTPAPMTSDTSGTRAPVTANTPAPMTYDTLAPVTSNTPAPVDSETIG